MFEIRCLTGYHWNKSPQLLFYTLQQKKNQHAHFYYYSLLFMQGTQDQNNERGHQKRAAGISA